MKNKQEPIIDGLIQFLIKAKRDGYASGESTTIKEKDGSYSTKFEEGDFKFHDNWKGGEPFGGSEIVYYKGKPVWMMVYYGEEEENAGAIPTLRKALSKMPNSFPARGPEILEDGDFKYENKWTGSISKFSGQETIFLSGKEVYSAIYAGGFVDRRRD